MNEFADALDDPGRISLRAIDRYANANDASHFELIPEAVIIAAHYSEVARILAASAANDMPVTFRSGGTSLSGQGVTSNVLVDVRRNFRKIEILDDGRRVRTQPGATVRQVNARLARFGRKLGPDPASELACTIGGVVANNSSGMSCGTHSNAYRTLESMVAVLPSGTVVDTSTTDADAELRRSEPDLYDGLLRIRDRIRSSPQSVATLLRLFSMKNTMGYGLNAFLDFDDPVDILSHLIIGSEGTLAFVAEVVWRTVPVKAFASTGFFIFKDLRAATESLPALIATGADAIELMDSLSLKVARRGPDAPEALQRLMVRDHAALLVEYQASSEGELASIEEAAFETLETLAAEVTPRITTDAAARASLWHLRKGLYATVAEARPAGTTALLEDIVVPVPPWPTPAPSWSTCSRNTAMKTASSSATRKTATSIS